MLKTGHKYRIKPREMLITLSNVNEQMLEYCGQIIVATGNGGGFYEHGWYWQGHMLDEVFDSKKFRLLQALKGFR